MFLLIFLKGCIEYWGVGSKPAVCVCVCVLLVAFLLEGGGCAGVVFGVQGPL